MTNNVVFAKYPLVHQWVPFLAFKYMQGKEEWYVHSPRATYAQLKQCRATALTDQARARKRHWRRAYLEHSARLATLDMVLETFGPLMAQHPTMTLAEACGDTPPEGQGSAPRLPPGYTHPLRRVREL
jgi:hypothetical protein